METKRLNDKHVDIECDEGRIGVNTSHCIQLQVERYEGYFSDECYIDISIDEARELIRVLTESVNSI